MEQQLDAQVAAARGEVETMRAADAAASPPVREGSEPGSTSAAVEAPSNAQTGGRSSEVPASGSDTRPSDGGDGEQDVRPADEPAAAEPREQSTELQSDELPPGSEADSFSDDAMSSDVRTGGSSVSSAVPSPSSGVLSGRSAAVAVTQDAAMKLPTDQVTTAVATAVAAASPAVAPPKKRRRKAAPTASAAITLPINGSTAMQPLPPPLAVMPRADEILRALERQSALLERQARAQQEQERVMQQLLVVLADSMRVP